MREEEKNGVRREHQRKEARQRKGGTEVGGNRSKSPSQCPKHNREQRKPGAETRALSKSRVCMLAERVGSATTSGGCYEGTSQIGADVLLSAGTIYRVWGS